MKLANVAAFFETDQILDGYTGALLFEAHMKPPGVSTTPGALARQQVLITRPTSAIPARRVLQIYDDFWIVGSRNVDGWEGQQIRAEYELKLSTGVALAQTPAQACLGTSGTLFHTQQEYLRDSLSLITDNALDVMWMISCPANETVVQGTFFQKAGVFYRTRGCYTTLDGYTLAEADQFDVDTLQTAVFTSNGAVNLVTSKATVINVPVPVLQTDQAKFYQFRDEVEATRKPNDRTVFVAASSLTPVVGANFTMLGRNWNTLAVVPEMDAWALHVRPA